MTPHARLKKPAIKSSWRATNQGQINGNNLDLCFNKCDHLPEGKRFFVSVAPKYTLKDSNVYL